MQRAADVVKKRAKLAEGDSGLPDWCEPFDARAFVPALAHAQLPARVTTGDYALFEPFGVRLDEYLCALAHLRMAWNVGDHATMLRDYAAAAVSAQYAREAIASVSAAATDADSGSDVGGGAGSGGGNGSGNGGVCTQTTVARWIRQLHADEHVVFTFDTKTVVALLLPRVLPRLLANALQARESYNARLSSLARKLRKHVPPIDLRHVLETPLGSQPEVRALYFGGLADLKAIKASRNEMARVCSNVVAVHALNALLPPSFRRASLIDLFAGKNVFAAPGEPPSRRAWRLLGSILSTPAFLGAFSTDLVVHTVRGYLRRKECEAFCRAFAAYGLQDAFLAFEGARPAVRERSLGVLKRLVRADARVRHFSDAEVARKLERGVKVALLRGIAVAMRYPQMPRLGMRALVDNVVFLITQSPDERRAAVLTALEAQGVQAPPGQVRVQAFAMGRAGMSVDEVAQLVRLDVHPELRALNGRDPLYYARKITKTMARCHGARSMPPRTRCCVLTPSVCCVEYTGAKSWKEVADMVIADIKHRKATAAW